MIGPAVIAAAVIALTGHPGIVAHCDPTIGVSGLATPGGAEVWVQPLVCRSLVDRRDPGLAEMAAQTVAHEAAHIAGVTDEGWADCYGYINAGRVLRAAGWPPRVASRLGAALIRQHTDGEYVTAYTVPAACPIPPVRSQS